MSDTHQTTVVTGAGSGVGFALVRELLASGKRVAAIVRRPLPSEAMFDAAIRDRRMMVYEGDLADQESREGLIARLANGEPKIEVLFNNAGVSPGEMNWSPQGRELCFEVNMLAPYLLLQGLRKNLAWGGGRVVNTSSNALLYVKQFDAATLTHPNGPYKKLFGPYAQSKLALSLWTYAIADELSQEGIKIVSADPGPNKTAMTGSDGMPLPLRLFARLMFKPPSHGAHLLLQASVSAAPSGSFLTKGKETDLPFLIEAPKVLGKMRSVEATCI
jgi:NAD(P)-dependent dehydrogenase (short-subunit alcohol dehydrogenase family)